ncbi:capsular polysaccharide synthesis protein [Bifidobacterium eulemuris]|uniref:Capsular polysaccharide biosynthesis protein n=1 Tax=Bifidobacterium eulemuris TaxID=1765219 RepID=A0A261GAW9_9BIFI|nr:capsular polysaccharide synthesis protein [Bifidobacterium eulemuris]OZG68554.1 capsular polysaccharide biosynthesis protein [Bifidobacterium eulemuris]QOL32683.1 hypothetical protein BE0216_09725 [Bifidobacterium eulemuris]
MKKYVNYLHHFGLTITFLRVLSKKIPACGKWYSRKVEAFLATRIAPYVQYDKSNSMEDSTISSDAPIWIMWWQGLEEAPEIVKKCYQSVLDHAGNRPVHLLSEKNFADFAPRSKTFLRYVETGEITLTHFSDFLRFELLYLHGGIWLDATLFMSNSIDSMLEGKRLFSIRQGSQTFRGGVWDSQWSLFWTAYCWGGCAGEPLFKWIIDMFDEYHHRVDIMIDYLLVDRVINLAYTTITDAHNAIEGIPDNNGDTLYMQSMLNKPAADFLPSDSTSLYKLSWKEKYQLISDSGKPTLYALLMKEPSNLYHSSQI